MPISSCEPWVANAIERRDTLIAEMHEALSAFVEFNAEKAGNIGLADCDALWEKAEIVIARSSEHLEQEK